MADEQEQLYATATDAVHKFWGFTAVIYTKGDPLSLALGIISLVPVIFMIMLFTVGVMTPTRRTAFLCTSMALNFIVSVVLKQHVFQQSRPEHPWALASRTDFGMPSNHTQFMSYLLMACLFSAIDYAKETRYHKSIEVANSKKIVPTTPDATVFSQGKAEREAASPAPLSGVADANNTPQAFKVQRNDRRARLLAMKLYKAKTPAELMASQHALRLLGLFVLTILVGYSRVYNVFHTTEQVFAGFFFGVVCAYVFYRIPGIYVLVETISDHTFLPLLKFGHLLLVFHS